MALNTTFESLNFNPFIVNDSLEHVYMRPEVISNRLEISNGFEKSFCLNDDFTAATFQTITHPQRITFKLMQT